jgi:ribosomal protein S18 acetylase RimI-like enzyme
MKLGDVSYLPTPIMDINPNIAFRAASRFDVSAVIEMLADDVLGSQREKYEKPLPASYYAAFEHIDRDPNNELIVATLSSKIVGVLQITFIPYLTHQGSWRAQIEGVRVSKQFRSQGIGRAMFEWAIARAKERNCSIVQLTTDKNRSEALRFYEELGFVATHHGMKLKLS